MFRFLIAFVLIFSALIQISAQQTICHAHSELIISVTPEYQQINNQLATFQEKLMEHIETDQGAFQTQLQEYNTNVQAGRFTEEQKAEAETKLQNLDADLQKLRQESEKKLSDKRQELLTPLLNRIQNAIQDTASENGCSYVLNQSESSGIPNILVAPIENDITQKVLAKLGVKIPGSE